VITRETSLSACRTAQRRRYDAPLGNRAVARHLDVTALSESENVLASFLTLGGYASPHRRLQLTVPVQTSALDVVVFFQRVCLWRRDVRHRAPMKWPKRGVEQGGIESLTCTSFRQASPVYPRASRLSLERHGGHGFLSPRGHASGCGCAPPLGYRKPRRRLRNTVKGVSNIWPQPLAGGPPQQVTHFTSGQVFNFAWSPEGRLVLARGSQSSDVVLITNFQ
jgi:hypothetical protein